MPSAADNTDALVHFLSDPHAYPHGPDSVELVHTHISMVAIAPPYVYKIKKPVDFGFLDFSTLEKRRHFCEEEVRLNSRLCPSIYRGVVTICDTGEGLRFDEGGPVVEVAVAMHQLDDRRFLHRLLAEGAVDASTIDRVAGVLHRFYADQHPDAARAEWGRVERLRISTDENFRQTERFAGTLVSRPAYDTIRAYTERFYDAHAGLLERRRAGGRVVDGHGDLRLEHIHLSPDTDALCIYDCIEFSERLRAIDVANDVAFLAMDLAFHARPDLARHLVDRMATLLEDPELPALADFYACYRAYVRAKVESFRSDEAEVPADERAASRHRAARYYRLALRYAVAGPAPAVVVVMGRIGVGKSTLAQALGEALGWEVAASDAIRKHQAGLPLHERSDAGTRSTLYAPARTRSVYEALRDHAVHHAARGAGAILDATYGKRGDRDALRDALRAYGIPLYFVEATADDDTIRERLKERSARNDVVSDARLEDFETLAARYEAPDALEDPHHFSLPADADIDETLTQALRRLMTLRRP